MAPGAVRTVALQGPSLAVDTWLKPDLPDEPSPRVDLVRLQGPLTPDRLLLRFDLPELPPRARVISATLMLQLELWGEQSLPGAAVAYRMLKTWDATSATYNCPWNSPGLEAGWDYDATPLGVAPVPDRGQLRLDVTRAVQMWLEEGHPNYGLVVMMSQDSHNQAHHWVYMTEQPHAADRPTLEITFEVGP